MESGSVRFRRLEGQADPGPSGLMGLVGLAAFVAAVSLIISVVSIGVALSVAAPTTNPTPSPPSPAPPAPPAGPDDCCTDFSNVTCSYYCLRHGQHVLSETVRFEPAQPELGITIEGRSAELVFPPDFNGSAALSFSAPGVFNTRVFINNLVINLEGTTATLLYALYFDQVHSSIKLDHIDVNSFTWRNQTGVYFESVNDYSNGTSDDRFALGPHVTNSRFWNTHEQTALVGIVPDPCPLHQHHGKGIVLVGGTRDWSITGNEFISTHTAVHIQGAQGGILSHNYFDRVEAQCNDADLFDAVVWISNSEVPALFPGFELRGELTISDNHWIEPRGVNLMIDGGLADVETPIHIHDNMFARVKPPGVSPQTFLLPTVMIRIDGAVIKKISFQNNPEFPSSRIVDNTFPSPDPDEECIVKLVGAGTTVESLTLGGNQFGCGFSSTKTGVLCGEGSIDRLLFQENRFCTGSSSGQTSADVVSGELTGSVTTIVPPVGQIEDQNVFYSV